MILRRDENGQYRQMKSLDDRAVSVCNATRRAGEKEEHETPSTRRPTVLITRELIFATVRVLHEWVSTRGNGF